LIPKSEDLMSFPVKIQALLTSIAGIYNKEVTEVMAKIYGECLKEYSFKDINRAVLMHCKDIDRGGFFPKPADIIFQLSLEKCDDCGEYSKEMIYKWGKKFCPECLEKRRY